MKNLSLVFLTTVTIAALSTSAFAGHNNYDSRTGAVTWVEDPVVPNGPHYVPDVIKVGAGSSWDSRMGIYTSAPSASPSNEALHRKNLQDCCGGKAPYQFDAYGNMAF